MSKIYIADFESAHGFYAAELHELSHATGHKARCNRVQLMEKKLYAAEELVAELGASFLCAEFGIDHASHHCRASDQENSFGIAGSVTAGASGRFQQTARLPENWDRVRAGDRRNPRRRRANWCIHWFASRGSDICAVRSLPTTIRTDRV